MPEECGAYDVEARKAAAPQGLARLRVDPEVQDRALKGHHVLRVRLDVSLLTVTALFSAPGSLGSIQTARWRLSRRVNKSGSCQQTAAAEMSADLAEVAEVMLPHKVAGGCAHGIQIQAAVRH